MHAKNNRVVVLALQLGSHMSYRHIESRFRSGIRGKAVFHLTEVTLRTRVTGHEDYGADGDVSPEECLSGDDGADSVSVQVEGEFVKRAGNHSSVGAG